jgi:hypothetical protein
MIDYKGSKGMSFNYELLRSLTFPGLIFLFQVCLAFHLFTPYNFNEIINKIGNKISNTIALLVIVWIVSTIFGFIINGIKWILFNHYHNKYFDKYVKEEIEEVNFFDFIDSIDKLTIIEKTIDNGWNEYESYANTFLSMLPGIFIFPYYFYSLNFNCWFIILFILFYIGICIILFMNSLAHMKGSLVVYKMLCKKIKNK